MNESTFFEVKADKYLNHYNLECLLKSYFYKSKLKIHPSILFDFSSVVWCGILELSTISLWIYSLRLKKRIIFIPPQNIAAKNFFLDYGFFNFLKNNGIDLKNERVRSTYVPTKSPMFPLTYNTKRQFIELLNDLSDPKRYELIFKDIENSEIVKSNTIHSIILKELSENVFAHTSCSAANFVMTKLTCSSAESNYHRKQNLYMEYERDFFSRLSGQKYLSLAISDNGIGIYKKLISAYLDDPIIDIRKKNIEPTTSEIIKYAFLKHSTSRTDHERKRYLISRIESKSIKFPLPTGLYKVLNLTEAFKGFLFVRSTNAFVCYDFLSNKTPKITDNLQYEKFKSLPYFPGTQFKLYFPIETVEKKEISFYSLKRSFKEYTLKPSFKYISLDNYIKNPISSIDDEAVSLIQNLLDKIETEFVSNKVETILIFDACELKCILSKNIVHLIISHLMVNQNKQFTTVIVNISSIKALELLADFNENRFDDLKPIVCIDKIYKLYFIGATDAENKDLENVESFINDNLTNFNYAKFSHILVKYEDSIRMKFSRKELIEYLIVVTKKKIESFYIDPANKLFHPNLKVLIPKRYYCLGFFETPNLFDNQFIVDAIKSYLTISFHLYKPSYIVTLGENCKSILNELYSDLQTKGYTIKAEKFHVDYPINIPQLYRYNKLIDSSKKLIFLTDVIGTANTIKTVLSHFKGKKIERIFTLVNTNKNFKDHIEDYRIESILYKELETFIDMPKNWNYGDVFLIDIESNRIIQKTIPRFGPLWIDLTKDIIHSEGSPIEIFRNDFLEKVVGDSDSFYSGHFVSRNSHLTCLFNIPILVDSYLSDIGKIIIEFIQEHIVKIRSTQEIPPEVSYILYPTFNPGLDKICYHIASKIPRSKILPISDKDLSTGLHNKYDFSGTAVIIIDDAFVSGRTIDKMIDHASNNQAEHIFVFALLKRGDSYQGRRFELLKKYGDTTIQARYLVDAEIPTYRKLDCPVCNMLKVLNKIKKIVSKNNTLVSFLDTIDYYKIKLREKDIVTIFKEESFLKNISRSVSKQLSVEQEEEKGNPFTYANIRWKLQRAKSDLGMRKDLNDILKTYETQPDNTLLLIRVLSDEKLYFFNEKEFFDNVFYSSFINNLSHSCRHFINQIEGLTEENVFCLLNISIAFDEQYFLDNLQTLLIKSISNNRMLYTILLFVFLTESAKEKPLSVSHIFRDLSKTEELFPIHSVLQAITNLFKTIFDEFQTEKQTGIGFYNELKAKIHNINHKIADCKHCLTISAINFNKLKRHWFALHQDLEYFTQTMTNLICTLSSDYLRDELQNILTQIEMCVKEIMKHMDNPSDNKELILYINRIYDFLNRRQIQEQTDQISNGLPSIIKELKIDIYRICYETLHREEMTFKQRGKWFDFDFPKKPFVVYGEEPEVYLIFNNLIKNALIHSNGKFLYIKAFIDKSSNNIDILFIDDGNERKDIKFGEGLTSVNDSCNSCGGSFFISQIIHGHKYLEELKNDPRIKSLNTIAQVSLPLMV